MKLNMTQHVVSALALSVLVSTAAQAKPDAAAALTLLKEGNARFAAGAATHPNSGLDRVKLASESDQGNFAYATVLSCSDSRVPVERLFDAGIMDLFIIRVAGNVCDTDEIGSIEYGTGHVKTPVLVILGHSQCGAVKAVTAEVEGKGHALEQNIPPLVDNIIPAVKRAKAAHPDLSGGTVVPHGIEENVWQSMADLFIKSPAVRELVTAGEVKVVGAIYDLATGTIQWLPEEKVADILTNASKSPGRVMKAASAATHEPAGKEPAKAAHAKEETPHAAPAPAAEHSTH